MDCEVSEEGVAAIRREYDVLVKAGLGHTHEWLDSEDELLDKMPLLPRGNIKVKSTEQRRLTGTSVDLRERPY